MQWSISAVGNAEQLARELDRQRSYLPDELIVAFKSIVAALPMPEGKVLLIESDGHVDATHSDGQLSFRHVNKAE